MDWLARQVVEVMTKTCGEDYAEELADRFTHMQRHQVVTWLNNLDNDNLKALADHLGICPTDLDITRRTMRSL